MIKYLGSKRRLVSHIVEATRSLLAVENPEENRSQTTVLDAFSGTSRVSRALRSAGFRVVANDYAGYAQTWAKASLESVRDLHALEHERVLVELREAKPQADWFTQIYCNEARYFHPKNGERIEGMRRRIGELSLSPLQESLALCSLMLAADRVDSTTGVQMAYLKTWAARANNDLNLKPFDFVEGPVGMARQGDALLAVQEEEVDVAYFDPPYNQHSYLGNYHVWETLVRFDRPEVYGIAKKRIEVRTKKSLFNRKNEAKHALMALFDATNAKNVVLSFNDEGYCDQPFVIAELEKRGAVGCIEVDYPRYVGATIGVYNPSGEKVGSPTKLRNRELIYTLRKTM